MAYQPHDVTGLEWQLNRLNAFGTVANRLLQEPLSNWDEGFTECLFCMIREMSDASAAAWTAFHGPDAPPAV